MKRKKFLQIVELSWVMQTWVLKTTLLRKMGSRNTTFPTWNGEFQVGITHSYRSTTPSHQPPSLLSIHFSPTPIKFVEFLDSQVFFIDIFYFKEKLVSPLRSL